MKYSPIPNLNNVFSYSPLFDNPAFSSLGSTVTSFYEVLLLIAITLVLIWLVWGAFQYIVAGGDKEGLSKARSRITWAIIGLLVTVASYLIAQLAAEIIQPRGGINF